MGVYSRRVVADREGGGAEWPPPKPQPLAIAGYTTLWLRRLEGAGRTIGIILRVHIAGAEAELFCGPVRSLLLAGP